MIIRILFSLVKVLHRRFIDIMREKRAEGTVPLSITIGNCIYNVACSFKQTDGATISDKLLRLMEKELEITDDLCYNNINTNIQKSLDCKPKGRVV